MYNELHGVSETVRDEESVHLLIFDWLQLERTGRLVEVLKQETVNLFAEFIENEFTKSLEIAEEAEEGVAWIDWSLPVSREIEGDELALK